MTNLETLQKQQLEAMNQMYAQTLQAATGMTPVNPPQNNVSQLESQLAQMQANMQQMMQVINQQQQVIQAQQSVFPAMSVVPVTPAMPTMNATPSAPVHAEPVVTKHVAEPQPATAPNEDVYKVSSKLIKPCDTCPFAQTCAMRTKQGINEQCGQEVLMNKQIMLQGGKMQARFNFDSNEIELLSNGKVVSVVQDIKSNQNRKFINFMVKNNQVVDVQVISDQKQPNSIYTTCTVEVIGFAEADLNVVASPSTLVTENTQTTPDVDAPTSSVPMSEPVSDDENTIYLTEADFFAPEDEEESYLSEDEMAQYDAIYSSFI